MNLPHDLLSQSVGQLIIAAYRIRGATYLIVKDNGSAYWSNIVSTKYHSITEAGLIEQIRFLVDNIYIQVGNRTFRHTNGNRLDCAPLLASPFLFHYEYKFMKDRISNYLNALATL